MFVPIQHMKQPRGLLQKRLVQRTRLFDALTSWPGRRVIRIIAPGGFGKSTLASMWLNLLAELPAAERPLSAWLQLSAADAALDVFLTQLTEVLGDHFPRLHEITALAAAGEFTLRQITHTLGAEFATAPRPLILVLDDVHLIGGDGAVLDLLQYLLDDSDIPLHLVLLTRTRPPLDLSRLQLDGLVLSLDVDDLIFDKDEFAAFSQLNRLSELPSDQLAYVEQRAGGWAAGLQLFVQSLPATRALSLDVIQNASSADLWTYIENVIFNRAGRHLAFMVETALLPVLHAELCAAITKHTITECAEILEVIAASNGLVTPCAPPVHAHPGEYFRVHPVLRNFLQRRLLRSRDRAALTALRRRAAAYLAHNGNLDTALDLLLPGSLSDADAFLTALAPDTEFAVELVQAASRAAILRGEILAVRRWLGRLPDSAICAHPQLTLDAAWCAFHVLDPQMHTYLTRARDTLPLDSHDELRAEVTVLETLCALHHGNISDAAASMQTALALPHAPDGITAGYLHTLRGYIFFEEARALDERKRDFRTGYEIFTRNGYLRGRIETLICEQWICESYTDAGSALIAAERSIQLLAESGMESSAFGIYSHIYAAQNFYLLNRITDARRELNRVLELTTQAGLSNVSDYHARVRLQMCDLATDARTIPDFDPVEDTALWTRTIAHSSPVIASHTGYLRILRDARLGQLQRIQETTAAFARSATHLGSISFSTIWLTVLAGSVLSGQRDPLILERLTTLRRINEAVHSHSIGMAAHALQVLHLQTLGREDEALTELCTLLDEIERNRFVRVILDFAQPLQMLLERAGTPFADSLLRITHSAGASPFHLSKTEQRVLEHLAYSTNTPKIAAAMTLSVTTVRTHVRNIYRKMHVHDREEAIQVAKAAGLI